MYIGIFNSISINIFVDRKKNRKTFVFRFLGGEFSTYGLKVSHPMLSGNSSLTLQCHVVEQIDKTIDILDETKPVLVHCKNSDIAVAHEHVH